MDAFYGLSQLPMSEPVLFRPAHGCNLQVGDNIQLKNKPESLRTQGGVFLRVHGSVPIEIGDNFRTVRCYKVHLVVDEYVLVRIPFMERIGRLIDGMGWSLPTENGKVLARYRFDSEDFVWGDSTPDLSDFFTDQGWVKMGCMFKYAESLS